LANNGLEVSGFGVQASLMEERKTGDGGKLLVGSYFRGIGLTPEH
jgi:hypothetical protein